MKFFTNKMSRLTLLSALFVAITATFCLADPAILEPLLGGGLAMAALGPLSVDNRGRIINITPGINGVSVGGTALLQLDVNKRYHRISLFTTEAGSAVAVGSIITGIKIIVNGISIRDISPANLLKIANANGYFPVLGELPIFFTEPFNNSNALEPDDMLSWDMYGQSTFAIQMTISGTVPGVTGVMEFDYLRNQRPAPGGGSVPFLQPVSYHSYSQAVVTGTNNINTIPYNFPIRRLWLQGSSAGNITSVELYADGNKVLEGTAAQVKRLYTPYGFKFANTPDVSPLVNATGPANLTPSALIETPAYYDYAMIFDPDGRWWKSLKIGQSLEMRVVSGASQTLTTVVEAMPASYAS